MERTVKADESVSYTVLCAVAEVEECSPTALPLLQNTVDVDALDALISSKNDELPQFEGSLMFEYSNCFVTIWSDRSVTVSISSEHGDGSKKGYHDSQYV